MNSKIINNRYLEGISCKFALIGKFFICCILFPFSLSSIAQTKLNFKYNCSNSVLERTQVSVFIESSNNKMELLSNDTIREFKNSLNILPKETDYTLFVEFETETIGKETLIYPFVLVGNETDIEINVRFLKNDIYDKKKRESAIIEVIQYYESNHNIELQYIPEMKGEDIKCPFFRLKNNSNDTIYGQYLNHFWGSIRFFVDSIWSREIIGTLDANVRVGSPLFPASTTIATVGTLGWRDDLPKSHYKYTLLYTTNKNMSNLVKQEKNKFVWRAGTKSYYILSYEFNVE